MNKDTILSMPASEVLIWLCYVVDKNKYDNANIKRSTK